MIGASGDCTEVVVRRERGEGRLRAQVGLRHGDQRRVVVCSYGIMGVVLVCRGAWSMRRRRGRHGHRLLCRYSDPAARGQLPLQLQPLHAKPLVPHAGDFVLEIVLAKHPFNPTEMIDATTFFAPRRRRIVVASSFATSFFPFAFRRAAPARGRGHLRSSCGLCSSCSSLHRPRWRQRFWRHLHLGRGWDHHLLSFIFPGRWGPSTRGRTRLANNSVVRTT